MKIAIDACGGDHAPLEILKGCAMAVLELGVEVVLFGDEETLKRTMEQEKILKNGFSFVNTTEVVSQHDDPTVAIRTKKNSSMVVGMKSLKAGETDAFVSAGSTGALLVGATLIVKRMKGVKRGALAPVIPTDKGGAMLIDCGANTDVKPEYLYQFGVMGSVYMEEIMGISNPKVGLLNIGTEETKGTQLQIDTYQLLAASKELNFYGNVEAREVPLGAVDVVVTDGFTGNILLKSIEGMGKLFSKNLKQILLGGVLNKVGALFLLKDVKAFQKKMDYKEEGGALLMGIAKPVVKAHGSSDAKAFKNAIRQAKRVVDGNMIEKIAQKLGAGVVVAQEE